MLAWPASWATVDSGYCRRRRCGWHVHDVSDPTVSPYRGSCCFHGAEPASFAAGDPPLFLFAATDDVSIAIISNSRPRR